MEYTQEEKDLIYFYGSLRELEDSGFINCDSEFKISTKGLAFYDQLIAEGYQSSKETLTELCDEFFGDEQEDHKILISLIDLMGRGKINGEETKEDE